MSSGTCLASMSATSNALRCLTKPEMHLSWRNWCAWRRKKWITPRGTAGSHGKFGDTASLSVYRVNSAGPRFIIMFSHPNPCKYPWNVKKINNPCETVESYFSKDLSSSYVSSTLHHVSCDSFSIVVSIISLLHSTSLYHLPCKWQPVFELHLC